MTKIDSDFLLRYVQAFRIAIDYLIGVSTIIEGKQCKDELLIKMTMWFIELYQEPFY